MFVDMTPARREWDRMDAEDLAGQRADMLTGLVFHHPHQRVLIIHRMREFDEANGLPRLSLREHAAEIAEVRAAFAR